jgi:hypothetical protein
MDPALLSTEIVLVVAAAGLAGFVDAIVGGGGLVLVPALLGAFPAAPPALLFGTNKAAAVWGTGWAAAQFFRRVSLSLRSLLPAVACAAAGSAWGAWAVTQVDATGLRKLLPWLLAAVLAYTLARKDLGRHHAPRFAGRAERLAAAAVGAVVGAYDGFFGPGTGSFLVFLFVRVLGYDFLHASAAAKLLNTATNAAALILFASKGQVWWRLGLMLALANILGSLLGTRMALKRGAGFVRGVFVLVVTLLIAKTAWDAYRP